MSTKKIKEFFALFGGDEEKAKEALRRAELTEKQAEEWGIRSKQKEPDQVEFIGDMTPEAFQKLLQETITEALGKKAPAVKPGKATAGGKKKTPEQIRPEKKLGSEEKPGSGRRRTKLSNTEKPKPKAMAETQKEIRAKGIDVSFMSFILPGLGKGRKSTIRTKDGSQKRSPDKGKENNFWHWFGLDI